jgi:hypothetical protein
MIALQLFPLWFRFGKACEGFTPAPYIIPKGLLCSLFQSCPEIGFVA